MNKFSIPKALCTKASKQIAQFVGYSKFGLFVACVAGSAALSGCGQKNSLYLPEEANPNTKFILYKNEVNNTDSTQKDAEDTESEVVLPVSEDLNDPNNY